MIEKQELDIQIARLKDQVATLRLQMSTLGKTLHDKNMAISKLKKKRSLLNVYIKEQ